MERFYGYKSFFLCLCLRLSPSIACTRLLAQLLVSSLSRLCGCAMQFYFAAVAIRGIEFMCHADLKFTISRHTFGA